MQACKKLNISEKNLVLNLTYKWILHQTMLSQLPKKNNNNKERKTKTMYIT